MRERMTHALIALVLAWAIPATADVIFDNGTTPSNSYVSDTTSRGLCRMISVWLRARTSSPV